MAKRKTPKSEKIIDLKPKSERLEKEELERLQDLVSKIESVQREVGILEQRKHNALHSLSNLQEDVNRMQVELENKYGKADVDVKCIS